MLLLAQEGQQILSCMWYMEAVFFAEAIVFSYTRDDIYSNNNKAALELLVWGEKMFTPA